MSAIFDSSSEVNAIYSILAEKLSFVVRTTNVGIKQIDCTTIETYKIVVVVFLIIDQADKIKFFKKIFLVVNISPNVVLKMPFLIMSVANVDFPKKKLQWRSYTMEKALSNIKRVTLVGKKEFATAAFDLRHETFVVHVSFLESSNNNQEGNVHLFCRAQIAILVVNKVSTSIFIEYSNFTNVFFLELTLKFPEHTGINNHTIELVNNQQPFYRPIYNLGLVELETLKSYIEINLANNFIRLSKSPVKATIFFNKKPDGSLQLCVDYQGLNNLTIKN